MTIEEIVNSLKKCKKNTVQKIKPFGRDDMEEVLVVSNEMNQSDKSTKKDKSYIECLNKIVKEFIKIGQGAIEVELDNKETLTFQTTEKCYHCDNILFEMTASDFSFNNPESMCPVCKGLGSTIDIDVDSIVKDKKKSILDGASPFWGDMRKFQKNPNANWMKGEVLALGKEMNIDLNIPWEELDEDFKRQLIYGSNGKEVSYFYKNKNGREGTITRPVEGAYNILKRLLSSDISAKQKSLAEEFIISKTCDCCKGERLKLESRIVTINDTRFQEVIKMNLEELREWVMELPNKLSETELKISGIILQELYRKLSDYIKIGIGYLTLDRTVPTLSGGEWQRLQLVRQLNSGLSNILYILDEPTSGLHPKDYQKLMEIINQLKELNNTVIIVEHTRDVILAADNIIDIGKGAGELGGKIIAEGTPDEIMKNKDSETGLYLSGKKVLSIDGKLENKEKLSNCHKINNQKNNSKSVSNNSANNNKINWIKLNGVKANNLKNINIKFPTNLITCITGVSGSGKSTLVNYGILPAVKSTIENSSKQDKKY